MKFHDEQRSTTNNLYRIEINNFQSLGTSYPHISLMQRFEDGREQAVWVIPFSHETHDIGFYQLIDNNRFVVMSEKGRVKIYSISSREQIYHNRFTTHFNASATLSHDRASLHIHIEHESFDRQLVTLCLETLNVVSIIDLPSRIDSRSLYARGDGRVQIKFQARETDTDNELEESLCGVYCIDPYIGDAEKHIMVRTYGTPGRVPSLINESLDLMLLPAWQAPETAVDTNGNTSFLTSLTLYHLQTLEPVRTFPVWAIPERYLSMDAPGDIGIAAGLKREAKDEVYFEAQAQLLSCISNMFPAENADLAFWIQWGGDLFKKFSYSGQALSPYILATKRNRSDDSLDSVLIEELPDQFAEKALYEKDGKIYLKSHFDDKFHYLDVTVFEGADTDLLVNAVIRVEKTQAVSDVFLPDAVKAEFDRHRVSEVYAYSLYDQDQCLSALDRLIERTSDIEPLRLDDYLVVSIKNDLGYSLEENEIFEVAAQHPGGCEKVRKLIDNLLAYSRFNELYYNDDTPAFLNAVLALVKHCPKHIDTALEYMEKATHDNGSKVHSELIPVLIKAYQGTEYEKRMNEAVSKTGFSTESLPFIQVLDAKVNSLLHAPLWEFLETVGDYDDLLFVLAHAQTSFGLPEDLPETEETNVKAFWMNDQSAFIVCAFSDINEAVDYFKQLPLEVAEFAKVSQVTLFRHNPVGCPFETLEKASAIHLKAQAELASERWLIFNDFTNRNDDESLLGFDGYRVHAV